MAGGGPGGGRQSPFVALLPDIETLARQSYHGLLEFTAQWAGRPGGGR